MTPENIHLNSFMYEPTGHIGRTLEEVISRCSGTEIARLKTLYHIAYPIKSAT